MPSFDDLAAELRLKIFTFAVVAEEPIKIAAYPRSEGSDGRSEVALIVREQANTEEEKTKSSPDHVAALAFVSKQVSAETLPVLYGGKNFEFKTSRALELFLDQVGNNKQHLRNVGIAVGGYDHEYTEQLYGTMRRSYDMLATAATLQTISISHFDLCCPVCGEDAETDRFNFGAVYAEFMQAFHATRMAKGLRTNLDILRIVVPECAGCLGCGKPTFQDKSRKRSVVFTKDDRTRLRRCRCKCVEVDRVNESLVESFKRRAALAIGFQ